MKQIKAEELKSIVGRARAVGLTENDCQSLEAAVDTLEYLFSELDKKTLTLARMRSLFGLRISEKSKAVLGQPGTGGGAPEAAGQEEPASSGESDQAKEKEKEKEKKPRKGHGRNGVEDYVGAETVEVPHESLKPGEPCPECGKGKVYEQKHRPRVLLRVVGQAPVKATVYKLQAFRCNLCGKVFTAQPPEGVGDEKYDATSRAMIALLKYGSGLPFNRLEQLERNLGIPLPASTQWEVVRDAADEIESLLQELIRQAAQGEVLHNDDTSAKILTLIKENRALEASGEAEAGARVGIFTTGIVSILGEHRIALFFTGRKHAGENAEKLLQERASELGPPIQMCDALDRNVPATHTLLANCVAHGRRKFVEIFGSFPEECRHVLETLREVFKHEGEAKEQQLSPELRMKYHQKHSAPLMDELELWMEEQLDKKLVEPNSSLGGALNYMLNHWEPMTLFLREPGAPLDNNICERALKKFILFRKNAYFYKTENGARIGDLFMSLIHTAELNGVNAFDYLTELLDHADAVAQDPAAWLPWNYKAQVAADAES